jgi:predicted SprT family Zn-dependent metalloprotease
MKNYKCALEIMKQELNNKYVSPEIKYAFEASIEALEKQIPKQPVENFYDNHGKNGYDEGYTYSCPCCDNEIGRYSKIQEDWLWKTNCCPECGQKLKWDCFL